MPGVVVAAVSAAAVDFMVAACALAASMAAREVLQGADTGAERAMLEAAVTPAADTASAGPATTVAVIIDPTWAGELQPARRLSAQRRQAPTVITTAVAATPTATAPGFARDSMGTVTRGTG